MHIHLLSSIDLSSLIYKNDNEVLLKKDDLLITFKVLI